MADNGKGKCHSTATRAQISQSLMGHAVSEESRRKMSLAKLGCIPWNKGTKGIVVAWNKGRKMSEEARRKMSCAKKGKPRGPMSESTRIKIRAARMGKKHSQETRMKISLGKMGNSPWNKGITLSAEHCRKLSISHRGKPSANKGRKFTPEQLHRLSESHKGLKYGPCSPAKRERLSIATTNAIKRSGHHYPGSGKGGSFKSPKNGRTFSYRSQLELGWYQMLEMMSKVVKYRVECVTIPYDFKGHTHRYIPDIRVWYDDGTQELLECKPEGDYFRKPERTKRKFHAARRWCRMKQKSSGKQISFRVVGYSELKGKGVGCG